jgi:hypothetical protein
MRQTVITLLVGVDNGKYEHREINAYLNEGWIIKQLSTAYTSKPGKSEEHIAVTLLLEHPGKSQFRNTLPHV